MTHAPGRIFGFIAGLFLLGALFGGCTSARADKPLPLEETTFSGSASQLQIDLPGRWNAVTQPLPVAPEAAPFVRDATRFDTERQDGLQLICAAVHFDNAAIAGRLGAPGTPARQNFYAAFQESALSAFIAEFQSSDAAPDVQQNRETLPVNGRDLVVLSVDYTSAFKTPGRFKIVLVPDDTETWIITLLYNANDKMLAEQIDRIIQSIRLIT